MNSLQTYDVYDVMLPLQHIVYLQHGGAYYCRQMTSLLPHVLSRNCLQYSAVWDMVRVYSTMRMC